MKSVAKYFPVVLVVSSVMFDLCRLREYIMLPNMSVFAEKRQQIGNVAWHITEEKNAEKIIIDNMTEPLTSNNPQFNDQEELAHLENYTSSSSSRNNNNNNNAKSNSNKNISAESDTVKFFNSSLEFERQIHLANTIPSNQSTNNNNNSMWYLEMMKNGLILSAKQQSQFDKRKHLLAQNFPRTMRYRVHTHKYSSIILNDEFAYRHIWKCGGTTMMQQTGKNQSRLDDPEIVNKKWITFIRDPIDHFLSGWAECHGSRQKRKSEEPYDDRVKGWLAQAVKCLGPKGNPCGKPNCIYHSLPQANFLLNKNRTFYPQMEVVGDLRELPGLLKMLGMGFNASLKGGRIASQNQFLNKYYPRRLDLLSNETLQGICKLVAVDYFLFDFDPPDVCTDIIGNVSIGKVF